MGDQVADAALAVHARAAEIVGGDVLAEHALHDAGSGQPDEGLVALDHERALAREIGAAAGVVAEHQTDRRHDAADLAQRRERLRITIETADARRHEGARGVVHADQGQAFFAGHVDQPRELRAVGRVHRAGAHSEVMTVDGDVAAFDVEDPGHDRSAVELGAPVAPEDRRLAVGQDLDPLPDRHPVLRVLHAHAGGAAAGERPGVQLSAHPESGVVDATGLLGGRLLGLRFGSARGQGIAKGILDVGHVFHVRRRSSRALVHASRCFERGSSGG